MILKRMTLKNFKGVNTLEVKFSPSRTVIEGANATGKTSIMDAYLWCLFGKDSTDRSDFAVWPIDHTGRRRAYPEIDTVSVEVEFDAITLKRVLTEKIHKGAFSGFTTEYYLDGVPVKAGVFNSKVEELFPPLSKYFSSPQYFAAILHWQNRRQVLEGLVDKNKLEAEVLVEFPEIPTDSKVDELERDLKASLKLLEQELKELPIRINEVRSQLPTIDLPEIMNSYDIERELAEVDSKIATQKEIIQKEYTEKLAEYNKKVNEINKIAKVNLENKNKYEFACIQLKNIEQLVNTQVAHIEKLQKKLAELRANFLFIKNSSAICPTCKQNLPPTIAEKEKEKQLEEIKVEGLRVKNELEEAQSLLDVNVKKITQIKGVIEQFEKFKNVENQHDLPDPPVPSEVDKGLVERKNQLESSLMKMKVHENLIKRLNELESKVKEVSAQFHEKNVQLERLKEYKIMVAQRMEVEVNRLFANTGAQVRLWRNLINGELEPICEFLINGVPFIDANHGAQINTGLKIVAKLSELLNVQYPVWVDNAEACNLIENIDLQVILLKVTDNKKLMIYN